MLGLTGAVACSASDSASTSESEIGSKPPRAWEPARTREGNLRLGTFNIRNFPSGLPAAAGDGGTSDAGASAPDTDTRPRVVRTQDETDEAMLVELLDRLDFDLLAVQEINEPERLVAVLDRLGQRNGRAYQTIFSTDWEHPQRVGVIARTDRLRLEEPKVHPEIATRPTMRAGLTARVTSTRPGGVDFGILVLHLASGDTGGRATLRATQATYAAEVVAARQAAHGDRDFVVLGDLNTAKEEGELPGLDRAMAAGDTGLTRAPADAACTSYYVKSKGVADVQPSLIDHVYLASMDERDRSVPMTVGAHCYERSCQPFESDSKEHGTSYWGVSDHCPVYFEIADEDRD
jgi:endonuclease/exonuclease/phosphatase family metal-dependent hydrolase